MNEVALLHLMVRNIMYVMNLSPVYWVGFVFIGDVVGLILYALGTALLVMVQTAYLLSANISLQLTLTGKSKFEVHV